MTLESAASRQSTSRALAGNIGSISRPGLGASGRYANRVGGDALLVIRALQVPVAAHSRLPRGGARESGCEVAVQRYVGSIRVPCAACALLVRVKPAHHYLKWRQRHGAHQCAGYSEFIKALTELLP